MADDEPTFAEQMVTKYQNLLLECAGLTSANVDGQQVSLQDLEAKLDFWERKVAVEQGKSVRLRRFNLRGC